jgi:elongation factor P--(R)-beta-lysine ligase
VAGRSPFWARHVHAARRPFLIGRGRVVAALREWFAARDFVEVETAALQVSPGNETHLHAFASDLVSSAGVRSRRYLRTSPELACKKLLSAGEPRIVEFARVYRNRERGALHAPEFTMLEWYRAEAPYEVLMEDCAAVVAVAAKAAGTRQFAFRGREMDPFSAPERVTVAQAFARHAAIDLMASLPPPGPDRESFPDRGSFAASAAAAGIRLADDDSWGDIFSRVLVERIEPRLGLGRATVLSEYPAALSALARSKPADPRVAERFELYACGIELANGFGELTDPVEQRRRLNAEMSEKERIYGERYPIDEDFLAALNDMPQASGVALGLDRLVMLATGAPDIDHVMWTPFERE